MPKRRAIGGLRAGEGLAPPARGRGKANRIVRRNRRMAGFRRTFFRIFGFQRAGRGGAHRRSSTASNRDLRWTAGGRLPPLRHRTGISHGLHGRGKPLPYNDKRSVSVRICILEHARFVVSVGRGSLTPRAFCNPPRSARSSPPRSPFSRGSRPPSRRRPRN